MSKIKAFFGISISGIKKFLKKVFSELKRRKSESRIYLTARFWIYIGLIVFAVFFTQALISSVSAVILVFLMLIPILSVLYIVIQAVSVKIYLNSDSAEIEKNSAADFSLTVANESPLPYPFLEAMISVTSDDAVRCENQLTRLSLIPFGKYIIRKNPVFRYRGSYMIGITNMYIYDLFRMVRYRIDTELFHEIFVMPRRMVLNRYTATDAESELTDTVSRHAGSDNTEINDIRDYIPGDGMRSVHWKLSSKKDDLLVKEFAKNNEKQSVIFVDTISRYEKNDENWDDDINEFVADGLIETALALVGYDITNRNSAVTVVWPDTRSGNSVSSVRIETRSDYEEFYKFFAGTPLVDSDVPLGNLSAAVPTGYDNTTVRFLSGRIDSSLSNSLADLNLSGADSIELYTFIPYEKIKSGYRKEYIDTTEAAQFALAKSGIKINDARDGRITASESFYQKRKEADEKV